MFKTESGHSIPLLDLSRFDAGEPTRTNFLSELRRAAHDVGFFYLAGHGIDPELLRALIDSSRRFFALPEADKQAIEMVNSPHFRGYTRVAWERTRGAPDWREQIDIGAERPTAGTNSDAPAWTRLQGPNQWPAALPELRPWCCNGTPLRLKCSCACCVRSRWHSAKASRCSSRFTATIRMCSPN